MGTLRDILSNFLGKTKAFLNNQLISGLEVPALKSKDYLESFRASSLVHSCTKKIGEKMSTIEFELYQLRSLTAREIEQHELLDLLAKPNDMMSGSQLIEISSIYLSLLGNCYWYKARNGANQVIELWLMRPDLTTIVPAKDGSVKFYKFTSGGKQTNYPAEDVIQFKEPDPLSDYYGYSAVQSAMETIRADVYAKKWNTKFFYNSARPDAILTTKEKIGKEDREEIRQKWTSKYGGWENSQKVAVLSHGLDYKQISVTQKDMDFANMRIANRDDVLMALQVPKSVIGVTDDVNRANADAGIYVFLSETIKPKMRKLADNLNQFLVNEFDGDLFLSFIDPTPKDKESQDDHYIKAHNKWLTTNEIRIEQGYEPIEGGDVIYQPFSLSALGQSDEGNSDEDNKGFIKIGKDFKAKDFFAREKKQRLAEIYKKAVRGNKFIRTKDKLVKDITTQVAQKVKSAMQTKGLTTDQKDVLWKLFDERLKGWERKWRATVRTLLRGQEKRALKLLKDSDLAKEVKSKDLGLLDFEIEVSIFSKKAKPIIKNIVDEAGNLALKEVGEKAFTKEFQIADPVVAEWIDLKTIKFAKEVNETTIKKLKNTLAEGVLEGESITELGKRVSALYELRRSSGANTVARTETLSANNSGTLFGYKQSKVVEKKEWLATRDKRTRDSHSQLDGKIIGIDKNFNVNGVSLEYPGDPKGTPAEIINCRCTIIPVISE